MNRSFTRVIFGLTVDGLLPCTGEIRAETVASRKARRRRSAPVEPLESRVLLSTVYVDANAPGPSHDGGSWTTAYTDLQAGLAAAASGDQIHVADGTYTPAAGTSFQLFSGLSLFGGYGGYGAGDPDARNVVGTPTILSRTDRPYGIPTVDASGTDVTTIFDGFTVTAPGFGATAMKIDAGSPVINNCTFTGGEGIDNTNGASPQITNCTFHNQDGVDGGGIGNINSSPSISNCVFENNFAVYGAAIYNYNSSISVNHCTFNSNQAAHTGQAIEGGTLTLTDCNFSNNGNGDESGGAINGAALTLLRCTFTDNQGDVGGAIADSSVIATDCTFTRNYATHAYGGAIYGFGPLSFTNCVFQGNTSYYSAAIDASSSDVTLTNCVFSGNYAGTGGQGAALSLASCTATVTNCTFSGNRSDYTGGAIWLRDSTLSLRNSILWGNSAGGDGKEIYIYPSGTSSVSFDHSPVDSGQSPFVRLPDTGADGVFGTTDDDYGDLRLRLYSSMASGDYYVDGGDNSLVPAGVSTDVAGNPRLVNVFGNGAIVDIGAYEYQFPLTVMNGAYLYNAPQPAVGITFNGDLNSATLSASDLVLLDPATNLPLSGLPTPIVSYDQNTRTVIWTFPSPLPDGNYRAKIAAGSVTDYYNHPLSADFTFDFFVLAGDANHDRMVDIRDLRAFAQNFGGTNKVYRQGNFDYDGDVDRDDLSILARNWQVTLAQPAPPLPVSVTKTAKRTATRVITLIV